MPEGDPGQLHPSTQPGCVSKGERSTPSAKAQPSFQRDPVKLDSKHYKVELENDRVRVVRIRYGPREKSVMHQHPPGIAVFITDGSFKFTYPDGKTENIQAKAGDHLYFGELWEH
jgi:quercetin dioxygenase-like cupin family protein